jgi:hypothetical protein
MHKCIQALQRIQSSSSGKVVCKRTSNPCIVKLSKRLTGALLRITQPRSNYLRPSKIKNSDSDTPANRYKEQLKVAFRLSGGLNNSIDRAGYIRRRGSATSATPRVSVINSLDQNKDSQGYPVEIQRVSEAASK